MAYVSAYGNQQAPQGGSSGGKKKKKAYQSYYDETNERANQERQAETTRAQEADKKRRDKEVAAQLVAERKRTEERKATINKTTIPSAPYGVEPTFRKSIDQQFPDLNMPKESQISKQMARQRSAQEAETTRKINESKQLKKSRQETSSFLDKSYLKDDGEVIQGADLPTKFGGKDTTFLNLLSEFNKKNRLDQDNQLKDLEKTIRSNRKDFGDPETANIRDDAILQKLVLEERGKLKKGGLKSTVVGFGSDIANKFVEDTSGQGQVVRQTLGALGGHDIAAEDAASLDKKLAKGEITKRQYVEKMNAMSNEIENIVGDGVDKGTLDRIARLVGNVANVQGSIVPLRSLGLGVVENVAKGGLRALGREVGKDALDNAIVSSLGSFQEKGINTDLSDAANAFIVGGAAGGALRGVGEGIGSGVRVLADKVKKGEQLTPGEINILNTEADKKAPTAQTPDNGDAIVAELQGAVAPPVAATPDGVPVQDGTLPIQGDEIVAELQAPTVPGQSSPDGTPITPTGAQALPSEGDQIISELQQAGGQDTPMTTGKLPSTGDDIIAELQGKAPVATGKPKGSLKPLKAKKTVSDTDATIKAPKRTKELRAAVDNEINKTNPELFVTSEPGRALGEHGSSKIPTIHVEDLKRHGYELPARYRRTTGDQDVDLLAKRAGFDDIDEYMDAVQRQLDTKKTERENKTKLAEMRRDPAITKKVESDLASERATYGTPEEPTVTKREQAEVDKKSRAKAEGKRSSRVFSRLQNEYKNLGTDEVMYNSITLKEEAHKATKLIEEDKQKAYRIAMGAEVSSDVTSTATNIAMVERALIEGDNALAAKLIKNRSLAQTRRGQEIVSERGSITDNSTSRYVKELIQARMKNVKEPLGKMSLAKDRSSKKPDATAIIDKEAAKIERQIKYKEFDVKKAQSLIDELACK